MLNPKDIFSLQAAAAPGYPNKDRLLSRVQARRLGSLILADSPDHWEEVRRYLEGLGEDDPGRRAVAYLLEAMDRLEAVVSDPDATLEGVVEAAAAMVEAGKAPSQQGHGDRELLRLRQLADRVPVGPWDTVRDQVQDLVDRVGYGTGRPARQRWRRRHRAHRSLQGPAVACSVPSGRFRDGKLPGQDAGRAHDRLTREERLFYLAASRSSEVLFFLMPQPGGSTDSQPCRFLTPLLDGGVVESVRLPPAGARGALCESQP